MGLTRTAENRIASQRRVIALLCDDYKRQPVGDPLNFQQDIFDHKLYRDNSLCPFSKFLLPVETNVTLHVQSPKRASTG